MTHEITAERARRSPPALPRMLCRFRRSQKGATAVEFGFVAMPFLMLIAAIFETAMMLWTSEALEEAVTQASRAVLTGQAQTLYQGTASANTAAFKNAICADAPGLVNCNKLTIDVRSYASFGSAQTGTAAASPIQSGALNTTGFGYTQTQPGQIVVVRAVLEYSLFFTSWSAGLANIGAGKRAIVASATFRSEPFTVPAT